MERTKLTLKLVVQNIR